METQKKKISLQEAMRQQLEKKKQKNNSNQNQNNHVNKANKMTSQQPKQTASMRRKMGS